LHLNMGEMDQAKDVMRQALTFDRKQAEAWYLLAQISTASGDYGIAQEAIEEALALHPHRETYVMAYVNLGATLQQTGEPRKALSIYEAVLKKDPKRMDVLVNAGIAYFSLSQYQEAVLAFEQAVVLAPQDTEIYLGLAQSYAGLGKIEKALAICLQGLQLDDQNADLLSLRTQLEMH